LGRSARSSQRRMGDEGGYAAAVMQAGKPHGAPAHAPVMFRHRPVPYRAFANRLIVARPFDGAPVLLANTAACVWRALDDWTTTDRIDGRLAEHFPEVAAEERVVARIEILRILGDDDLVESR